MAKTSKATIKKGHTIARAIERSGSSVKNPFAVGMAAAKKAARHK